MAREGTLLLEVSADRLVFEARSDVPDNRLGLAIDGVKVAEWSCGLDWMSGSVELRPYQGRKVRLQFMADRGRESEIDPRSLAILFRKLETEPVPETTAAGDFGCVPILNQGPLSRLDLPDIARLDRAPPPAWRPGILGVFGRGCRSRAVVLALKYFRPRDAISHEVLAMADLLRADGMNVYIVAEQADEEYRPTLPMRRQPPCAWGRKTAS